MLAFATPISSSHTSNSLQQQQHRERERSRDSKVDDRDKGKARDRDVHTPSPSGAFVRPRSHPGITNLTNGLSQHQHHHTPWRSPSHSQPLSATSSAGTPISFTVPAPGPISGAQAISELRSTNGVSNNLVNGRHRPPIGTNSPTATTSPPQPTIPPTPVSPSTSHPPTATSLAPPQPSSRTPPRLNIATYPSTDLLKLLASLLQQIATANDELRSPHVQPPSPQSPTHSRRSSTSQGIWPTLTTAAAQCLSSPTSALSFHARNIPTISIESYLLRILKYCPTTNEVFISLLVYFDRMSRMCADTSSSPGGEGFAIDSYNVHRLIIAGVTVASKFFSDVFYTNSRYAKVGGLPQSELNLLELKFLLLNDFRLVISIDEMQRYADQLLLYSTTNTTPPTPLALATSLVPASHTTTESESDTGYGTTDDEPTIRPSHSSGSSSDAPASADASEDDSAASSPQWRYRDDDNLRRVFEKDAEREEDADEEGGSGSDDDDEDGGSGDEVFRRGGRVDTRMSSP